MSSYDPSYDPACRVAVPDTYAHTDEAAAYWLSNPLLPAGRVAATLEQLPMLSLAQKQDMVSRLKRLLDVLRFREQFRVGTYKLLINLVRHELISRKEQADLSAHLNRLRGAEVEWEYERLEKAIAARVAAMHGQHQEPASQETDTDYDAFRLQEMEECDRDAA